MDGSIYDVLCEFASVSRIQNQSRNVGMKEEKQKYVAYWFHIVIADNGKVVFSEWKSSGEDSS